MKGVFVVSEGPVVSGHSIQTKVPHLVQREERDGRTEPSQDQSTKQNLHEKEPTSQQPTGHHNLSARVTLVLAKQPHPSH